MAVELAKFNELNTVEALKKMRLLVEELLKSDEDGQYKMKLIKEYIQWAKKQNRIYLQQSLTVQFAKLLNKLGKFTDAANLSEFFLGKFYVKLDFFWLFENFIIFLNFQLFNIFFRYNTYSCIEKN